MKILYASFLQNKIGKSFEVINNFEGKSVSDLFSYLKEKNPYIFETIKIEEIYVSVNGTLADSDYCKAKIGNDDEVYLFTAISGG